MKKKELLTMRQLNATNKMITAAKEDVPKKVTVKTYWGSHQDIHRKYHLYMRCCIENGILKAALYYPDSLRVKGRQPSYEVYIDRSAGQFITYDRINNKWLEAKLDRLGWPLPIPAYPEVWISKADAKLTANYLNSNKPAYRAILSYQEDIREKARILRDKRETDKWDADMALTPMLPKDWEHWVKKVGIPQNYIFYEYRRRGAKTGYCTYCEKDIPITGKPRHNLTGRCPCCRHEVTYKSVGKLGWRLDTDEVCIYLIQPRPDGFVVREFWAWKRYLKESLKFPETYCTERWRTIYDPDLSRCTYYWGTYKQRTIRWIAGVPAYSWLGANSIFNSHGDKTGRVYGKTLPRLKSMLKQTGLLEWIYGHRMIANPDAYFFIRKRIPQFEQIWKAGLPQLANECEHNDRCMYGLIKDPKSTVLSKALGISRQALKRLRQFNGGTALLRWLQVEKQCGTQTPDEVLIWFCEQGIKQSDLDFIWGKMNAVQIYNYLRRQSKDSGEDIPQVLTTWRDYLSMAEQLGIDTSDEIIYRAKLLRQRHDELVLRCEQRNQEERAAAVLKNFPNVDKICQSIKGKYEYANDKFAVVVPNGALDIIVEGSVLCHCVGSSERYWERIEHQEAFILFLRRAATPHLPYYTLEVEPDGTVRQKRTKFDRQDAGIEEAKEFLTEWQQVITKRLTASDRKKAVA